MRALVALSNARDILRPPETFSGDDLNVPVGARQSVGPRNREGRNGCYGPSIRRGMC